MKLATLLVFLAVATVSGDDSFGEGSFSRTGGTGQRAFMERLGRCGKRGYLVGFSDGIMLPLSADSGDNDVRLPAGLCVKAPGCLKNHFGRSTYGEIMEGLDDLYLDPANVQISVPHAMAYSKKKLMEHPRRTSRNNWLAFGKSLPIMSISNRRP